jgi:hypothetical protein
MFILYCLDLIFISIFICVKLFIEIGSSYFNYSFYSLIISKLLIFIILLFYFISIIICVRSFIYLKLNRS